MLPTNVVTSASWLSALRSAFVSGLAAMLAGGEVLLMMSRGAHEFLFFGGAHGFLFLVLMGVFLLNSVASSKFCW